MNIDANNKRSNKKLDTFSEECTKNKNKYKFFLFFKIEYKKNYIVKSVRTYVVTNPNMHLGPAHTKDMGYDLSLGSGSIRPNNNLSTFSTVLSMQTIQDQIKKLDIFLEENKNPLVFKN